MACDCLNTLRKLIAENTGDPDASVDAAVSFGSKKNNATSWPRLTASYRKKKADGSFSKGNTIMSIKPTFCPFCGKIYEDKGEPDA